MEVKHFSGFFICNDVDEDVNATELQRLMTFRFQDIDFV